MLLSYVSGLDLKVGDNDCMHKQILKSSLKVGDKGQTAIEYLLILTVIITIGVAMLKKAKVYLVQGDASFLNQISSQLQGSFNPGQSATLRYKKFKLNK